MVAPGRFPHIERKLMETFEGSEFPDWVVKAAALHFFVGSGAEYSLTGFDVSDPDEMLQRLSGDCEDQSVLLASLYRSVGLDFRILFVRSDPSSRQGHVLVEVYCPVPDRELVCGVLRKFYRRELGREVEELFFEERSGETGFWLLADPEFSYYLGDLWELKEEGYARDLGGGGWEWTDLVEVQER